MVSGIDSLTGHQRAHPNVPASLLSDRDSRHSTTECCTKTVRVELKNVRVSWQSQNSLAEMFSSFLFPIYNGPNTP